MNLLTKRLRNYYPIIVLLLIEVFLFFKNYNPGTYFLGWDNLFPEANFPANFQRSIFAIWQEYRGLGLLDGMSYAANLPHYLFLCILSFLLPNNLLRYFFIFLMHFLGGVGIYLLISELFPKHAFNKITSLFGSLFYILNIATIQMFYTPYELFTVHFAFLPFLFLFANKFLEYGTRRNLLWFLVFSIFSLPQAHVPTIFLVYVFALTSILIFKFLASGREKLNRTLIILLITILVNSFWGIPYFYSALHSAKTISDSKINQMSTEDIYLKNKQFGDLSDVILLKGFSLNFVDNQKDGTIQYMMGEWRQHTNNSLFSVIGYLFFTVVILGIISSFKNKKKTVYPYIGLFIFTFLMLGDDIPILNIFSRFLNTFVPFFYQLFRFTFTKFSILYVLNYSILLSVGLSVLIGKLKKREYLKYLTMSIVGICLIYHSLPSFNGYFLNLNLRNKIPKEYFQLIDYFKKQDKNTRIATLPQPTYWGWTYTKWGYKGSGFLWYGLPQATVDGAFYPWSRENENYYWDISNAIYSADFVSFENILSKYQVSWLVIDENIINPPSSKAIYLDKLENLVRNSNKISQITTFGKIKVYRINPDSTPKNFVFLARDLPVVGPGYKWGNYDKGYEEYGNYISDSSTVRGVMVSQVQPATSEVSLSPTDNRKLNTDNRSTGGLGGFSGSFGFSREESKIEKENSQDTHHPVKQKVSLISSHVFDFLAKKYGKITQKINVKINPNISTLKEGLSIPGIFAMKGSTIEPAVNCPAATDTSIKARFWLIFNSSLFCSINNTLEKVYQLVNLARDLPVVGPGYKWNNLDKGYEEYGDYISLPENGKNSLSFGSVTQSRISNDSNSQGQDSQSKIEKSKIVDIKTHSFTLSLLGFFGYPIGSDKQENNDYKKNNYDSPQDIDNRNGAGHRSNFSFMSRVSEKSDNHTENKNGYSNNKIISNKGFIHKFLDSSALFVKNILNIQQVKTSITPIIAMIKSNFSSPVTSGDNTTAPRNTWPALSSMLANLRYSPSEKGNPFGRGLIKTIYAQDITENNQLPTTNYQQPTVFYPFRSLFTGRQQNELEFAVTASSVYFSFKTKIPKELAGYSLEIPALESKEVTELDASNLSKITVKTPEIYLDGEFVPFATSSANIIDLPYVKDGKLEVRVPKINGYYSSVIQPTTLNLKPKSCDQFSDGIYKHDQIDLNGERLLQLTSINSSNCLDFDLPFLSQDLGYLVTVENRNVEGKSLLFSVINKNSQRADIETYLPKKQLTDNSQQSTINKSYFLIPPMEQFGLGYTLHLDNISIGRVKTINDLGKITVNPIPYRLLTSLKLVKNTSSLYTLKGSTFKGGVEVEHPNPSFYQITISGSSTPGESSSATPGVSLGSTDNVTLVLSQSFDNGWHAYEITNEWLTDSWYMKLLIPLFGKEIKNHVLVNNWENGWLLPQSVISDKQSTIIIVYLPQYLEYFGFLLLGVGILIVIFYTKSRKVETFDHIPTTIN